MRELVMPTWSTAQTRLLKYLAFGAMVLDHGQKGGLWSLPDWLGSVGKLAFPLFMLTFALAVGQAGTCRTGRLLVLATVAQPAFMAIFGAAWYDLNALFVFVAGYWLYQLCKDGHFGHWFVAIGFLAACHVVFKAQSGGLFWPVSVALAICATSTQNSRVSGLWWVAAIGSWMTLRDLGQSIEVLAVLGSIVFIVRLMPARLKLPRCEFGIAYGAHLLTICCISIYSKC